MYSLLKLVHVLAVVLFLGNIVTGVFWHAHAARTRDPRLIAHAMDGIIRSDRWFTLPGVALIIATGVGAAYLAQLPLLRTGWILWTLILFAASGVIFMARVAPLQRRMREAARSAGFDYGAYRALARQWELWGAAAILTPLAGLALMVIKPSL